MKRVKNLWESVVSFENLLAAATKAQRGKLSRPAVLAFHVDMEKELWALKEELESGEYRPGPYRIFQVVEPKPRLISAAAYRDRVVHHALCNVIEPIFDRRFIYDSYANRLGKGTHRALERFTRFARRNRCVLKCDIEKYFASIDHQALMAKIARVIGCKKTLELISLIVAGSPSGQQQKAEYPLRYFPGDDLFTPVERRGGLPIGNLTSQLFANIYLDGMDHFVKETLGVRDYLRYLDDSALFSESKAQLREIAMALQQFLNKDRLKLHEKKTRVYRCSEGIEFLGFRMYRDRIRIKKSALARFTNRMRRYVVGYERGEIELDRVRQSLASCRGHVSQGNTRRLMSRLLRGIRFVRGPTKDDVSSACLSARGEGEWGEGEHR